MPDETELAEAGELNDLMLSAGGRAKGLETSFNGFGRAMTQAFTRGIADGKRFDDVLKSLTLRLSDLVLKSALKPLEAGIGKGIGGLFGGLLGAAGGGGGGAGITAFASGGVIASPSYFSLGQSGLGLAGEAGPEAILPLARGSDGRLGVAAAGGGAAPAVTVNISTPNAASFGQSEVYLTGVIARAVARGQRGL